MERNQAFDEWLDECWAPYQIGGLTFTASDILFECDPIAYRTGVSEHEDYLASEEEED